MSRVKLFEIQEQALAAEDAHRAEHPEQNRLAIVLPTGTGKGHPLETEVPTPVGWRRWGDLEPGDEVFGRDGSSTEVLEVYDRGVLETYRVTLSDGSSVLVDGDHLWAIKDAHRKGRLDQDVYRTLSTRDLATVNVRPMDDRGYRWHLPMTAPLERKPRDLPLDPYVVGALISNGSLVGSSTQLTTPDLEVAARVAAVVTCRKVNDRTPGVCDRYFLHGLVPVTRELGMRVLSREKRVPAAYLEGSLEQRVDLLHGLMDGDGGARDSSRRSVGYFTSSPGLARDVSELVTSLGGTGIVKRYDRGARGVEYAVKILLPSSVPAFSTSRKSHAGSSSTRNLQPKRAIVSIVLEGHSGIRCIRVAAPDSLYLIGRQHIVTHNTTLFSERARRFVAERLTRPEWGPHRVLILVHTDELTDQAEKRARFMCEPYSVGVVKADRDEVDADIIVASVQTLSVPGRKERITDVGYVIVDEVQYGVTPMWTAILEHFGCIPDCTCPTTYATYEGPERDCPEHGEVWPTPMLGVTATLARSDGQGFGDLIHEAVYTRSTSWAIRKGYLIDIIPYTIKIPEIDASASDARLDAQLADSIAPEAVVRAWTEQTVLGSKGLNYPGDPYPSTVLFAPLVKSAQAFADAFNAAGVKAEVVHGAMPKAERRAVLERYEAGTTTVICNAMALTVGWDSPRTMCVIVARPTKSVPLFCLDAQTEILTDQGWKGALDDLAGAQPAAYDLADGSVRWSPLLARVERPLGPEESMFALSSPTADIRVSDRHRMVWRGRRQTTWRVSEARDLAHLRSDYRIPIAGVQKASGVALTDDEIRFVGWFMTDGTINKKTRHITIYQAEHQPWNADIKACLEGSGFKYSVYRTDQATRFQRTSTTLRYGISYGKPRGTGKHLRGWSALEPYLSKDLAPALEDLTREQLAVLLHAMHLGDGAKQLNQAWTRRSYHISTGNKTMADRLQSLCVRRGFKCNVATGSWNDSPVYVLHIKDSAEKMVGGQSQTDRQSLAPDDSTPGETVWCVETDAGTLITRRNGKVAILGNCQMVGRGLRPWLSAEAPPREEQRCVLLCVSDGVTDLACVADLSDRPGEQTDGKTLTAMEDEWDLGRDIEPDGTPYAGPVVVERWDAAVQASSKAWKYTAGGIPFLPTAKRGEGYVFVVEQPEEGVHTHGWKVWLRRPATPGEGRGRFRVTMLATAPDLELAMALAEDAAHDHGGDIGRLLADKNRAWRKAVPSAEMIEYAQRLGINVIPILENRKGGKAGRLSDLIDKVVASRVIDPVAVKIKERVKA